MDQEVGHTVRVLLTSAGVLLVAGLLWVGGGEGSDQRAFFGPIAVIAGLVVAAALGRVGWQISQMGSGRSED